MNYYATIRVYLGQEKHQVEEYLKDNKIYYYYIEFEKHFIVKNVIKMTKNKIIVKNKDNKKIKITPKAIIRK